MKATTLLLPLTLLGACLPDFPERDYVEDENHDADGDGQTELEGDCDDTSALVYRGAPEICDERDNDCDGRADEVEDPDDGNFVVDPPMWYFDGDRDGYGSDNYAVVECYAPAGYAAVGGDCDDTQALVHPGAAEYCDGGLDNDCDGLPDDLDDDMIGDATWYRDADGDGYGDDELTTQSCSQPAGYVLNGGDCDDSTVRARPYATEVCDGIDNDCDGGTDDDDPEGAIELGVWFADTDSDGYGDYHNTTEACEPPTGYVADSTDCDDSNSAISPGADELCATALVDDDCDGDIDEADAIDAVTYVPDVDKDGYGDANATAADKAQACSPPIGYTLDNSDCDDTRNGVNPGETENCLTTFDDDCSGSDNDVDADSCTVFYADSDGDGYGLITDTACTCVADTATIYTSQVTGDCNDSDSAISPGDTETCSTVGIDDDCDGTADEEDADDCDYYFYDGDGDGFGINDTKCLCAATGYYDAAKLGDCDDADATQYPGASSVLTNGSECGLNGPVSFDSAAVVLQDGDWHSDDPKVGVALDYNRDGVVDYAVANTNEGGSYAESGAVYLWLGPFSSDSISTSGSADLRFSNDAVLFSQIGRGLTAGDVDGDGYDELLVGSYDHSNSESYLLQEGLTGLGTVDSTSTNVTTFPYGHVAIIGDINGDGLDDALMGSNLNSSLFYSKNSYVAYGSLSSGLVVSSDQVAKHCTENDTRHVCNTNYASSDLDGDGYLDLVITGSESSYTDYDIKIYQGGDGIWDAVPDFSIDGQRYSTWFSSYSAEWYNQGSFSGGGDINGDGYEDLLLGLKNAYTDPDPSTGDYSYYGGRVYLFEGASSGGGPVLKGATGVAGQLLDFGFSAQGSADSHYFGQAADISSDLNGDGFDDLTIGGKEEGNATYSSIWYGPVSFSGATFSDSEGDATFARPGSSVFSSMNPAPAGDANGDGYDDLWMTAGSSVYLFHGTPN